MSHQFYIGIALGWLVAFGGWFALQIFHAPVVSDDEEDGLRVDPWRLQRELMRASSQRTAPLPSITEVSLLYWALTLEEFVETTNALLMALDAAWQHQKRTDAQTTLLWQLTRVHNVGVASSKARDAIKGMGQFTIGLTHPEAKELLDGTTDIQVVNSGFALASGLPGPEGYLAVLTSNLSKRDSDGIIQKDPSGKWIKGPDYKEPDLGAVLLAQSRAHTASSIGDGGSGYTPGNVAAPT